MSEPSKEALAAANKMEAAFHCDARDVRRFAAIIQSAIDAATAEANERMALSDDKASRLALELDKAQHHIRELENYQLRMEGCCKVGSATELQILTHQLELANRRIGELEDVVKICREAIGAPLHTPQAQAAFRAVRQQEKEQ